MTGKEVKQKRLQRDQKCPRTYVCRVLSRDGDEARVDVPKGRHDLPLSDHGASVNEPRDSSVLLVAPYYPSNKSGVTQNRVPRVVDLRIDGY